MQALQGVRAVSLKDQEKFTSPWAVTDLDEEKFDKTISYLGRLLRDDIQLQALYHMLVMLSPCAANSKKIQVSCELGGVTTCPTLGSGAIEKR